MFHTVRPPVMARMRDLKERDRTDRADGTPRLQRLRQIPPETGQFLALLAAAAPEGAYIEIGTSAGYSTLWIALACELLDRRITTFEVLPEKVALARQTFQLARMGSTIDLVEGDARQHLPAFDQISFCFLDAEKEVYAEVYELVIPRLVKGGLLVADNAINHQSDLQPVLNRALSDERVDALVVPIGKGELVCRKI